MRMTSTSLSAKTTELPLSAFWTTKLLFLEILSRAFNSSSDKFWVTFALYKRKELRAASLILILTKFQSQFDKVPYTSIK